MTARPPVAQNGFAVRAFRERSGTKAADLAEQVGISEPHLRNIETENRSASPEHLARIADALGVPLAALQRVRGGDRLDNLRARSDTPAKAAA